MKIKVKINEKKNRKEEEEGILKLIKLVYGWNIWKVNFFYINIYIYMFILNYFYYFI